MSAAAAAAVTTSTYSSAGPSFVASATVQDLVCTQHQLMDAQVHDICKLHGLC